jgi:magnesium transporter
MAMSRTKPRRSRSDHTAHAKLLGADLLEEAHRAADSPSSVMRVASFVGDKVVEVEGADRLATTLARPDSTTWIDLTGASADEVAAITKVVGLHPLIAEDILEGNQRAKIEVTDELIHIVIFAFEYTDHAERTEIDIVLGKGFLLTVHGPEWDPRTVPALRGGLAPILARGPDHLLWALVDAVVDGYFPLLDLLGDAIEDVQEHVITNARPETLKHLFALKTELLVIRRAAAPIREIFNQLTNRDLALIDVDEVLYFRDVYDHLIRLTDELDNYRELVSGTLDVYLSTVNNQLSLIMKRLTGVTVVLTGIAAIAGIFGMSEAGTALGGKEAAGFWLVTLLTIALAFLMAWVLRRIGWI